MRLLAFAGALALAGLVPAAGRADVASHRVARITYFREYGLTYSGEPTAPGVAACSWNIPLYSKVRIAGAMTVTCLDRGELGFSDWIDVWAPDGESWVPQTFGDYADIEVIGD